MVRKILGIVGGVVLAASLVLNIFLFQKGKINEGELVTEVVDGDTFFIQNEQPIRLFCVNAPEIEFCYGKEAKEKLQQLIEGKRVILKEPITDDFGRVMAMVYVDGLFVNEEMIKLGMGLYESHKVPEAQILKKANEYARENKIGIFSSHCYQLENLDNPKCNIKGNIEKREGQKYYHLPGCARYEQTIVERFLGEEWFCSEKEAIKAGYTKATTCY